MDRRRLSVIVPAYNEADALRECLASLFAQIDEIHEVIVVDNNSTDQTQGVIAEFAALSNKFASVPATEQGVIFARTVGLDHATGDVLARIDADARVNPAWAKAVLDYFGKYGDTYQAGTGMCTIYDLPFQDGFRESHAKIAEETCRKLERGEPADTERLFGSNMAIKKSAWHQIRSMSSMRNDVHEDLDVTLCLKMAGLRFGVIPGADAQISGRRYLSPPWTYFKYCLQDPRTFAVFGERRQQWRAWLILVGVAMPFYLINWIPFRAYNPETNEFSLSILLHPPANRPSPRAHS